MARLSGLACLFLAVTIGIAAAYDYADDYYSDDNGYGNDDYASTYDYDYNPYPSRSHRGGHQRQSYDMYGRNSGRDNAPTRGRSGAKRMNSYGRSGTYGNTYQPRHVPVVIKKKKEKKRKIISSHSGFYIPGGTAVYGKFKDLHSCEKACELTPTCFAADFNPWLNKCYIHSNLTACQQLRAHNQITHFKKVPCTIVETPRGLITLGASSWNGLLQKGIDTLMDCIKACATAGGGVAPMPMMADDTPQLCFGIDYDFADHKCYFHISLAICGGDASTLAIPVTPVSLFQNPSVVNILICPIKPE